MEAPYKQRIARVPDVNSLKFLRASSANSLFALQISTNELHSRCRICCFCLKLPLHQQLVRLSLDAQRTVDIPNVISTKLSSSLGALLDSEKSSSCSCPCPLPVFPFLPLLSCPCRNGALTCWKTRDQIVHNLVREPKISEHSHRLVGTRVLGTAPSALWRVLALFPVELLDGVLRHLLTSLQASQCLSLR